ncbi:hypothetical protein [Deinococcus hopiensis]|uniref:DUF3108 domain-containing protein n=1 Tax=Deinococcus hopiensis KR-140 TaxID=695939 RepID=A0A1W1UCJ8_9DEIO|nr:hypothetical protein [Deinococcus hopiensis]SMB78514.1 hypothetical protein SAMN00790413_06689 [Deinococcus hopiensis KR-140]
MNILAFFTGAVLLGTPAHAACSTTYYPVKEGYSRTYKGTAAGKSFSYTETIRQVSSTGFTLRNSLTNTQAKFTCGQGGVVGAPTLTMLGVNITSIKITGVTQPPELAVGRTWTSTASVTGTVQGKSFTNTTRTDSRVLAQERVQVPAGSFSAMKVQITTTIRSSFGGKAVPEQRVVAIGWVAPGVGMVKTVADNTTVQLTEFRN